MHLVVAMWVSSCGHLDARSGLILPKVVFVGLLIMSVFLWLIGGLGNSDGRSTSFTNGMVASFILFPAAFHGSLAPAAFTTAAEIGTAALREKTMALGVSRNPLFKATILPWLTIVLDGCERCGGFRRGFLNTLPPFASIRQPRIQNWLYIRRHLSHGCSVDSIMHAGGQGTYFGRNRPVIRRKRARMEVFERSDSRIDT